MFKSTSHSSAHNPYHHFESKSRLIQLALGLTTMVVAGEAAASCNANQLAASSALSSYLSNLNGGGSEVPIDYQIPTNFEITETPTTHYEYSSSSYDTPCDANTVSITPDQIFAMGSLATRVNGGKITQPSDYFGLRQQGRRGGGAGDIDFPPLNFWSKIDSDFGSRDTTFSQPGFEFDNHNFVFGADYRIFDNWVAGGSFAYRHNTADFDGGRGETVNDTYTGTIYTAYHITDAAHVEATASYGGFAYDTRRNITYNGESSVAKASPEGGQYAFSWGGGYDFNIESWTIAPYARGEYMNLDIDGYSESGSPYAVRFGKQNIESLTSTVGIQTAYAFSFPWGVLIPQLRGEWHHQFMDSGRQIETGFVNDPSGQSFIMTSDGPSRDYYTFGAEVSSVFAGGISAFLAYETLQSYTSINSNKLMLGARLEF